MLLPQRDGRTEVSVLEQPPELPREPGRVLAANRRRYQQEPEDQRLVRRTESASVVTQTAPESNREKDPAM